MSARCFTTGSLHNGTNPENLVPDGRSKRPRQRQSYQARYEPVPKASSGNVADESGAHKPDPNVPRKPRDV